MKRILLAVLLAFHASAVPAAEHDLARILQNLAKMRDVAYEVEKYAIGHRGLPQASNPAELSTALMGSPSMVGYLVDPWGTPYVIDSDPARQTYTIVSSGSDGKFDRATWKAATETKDPAADVVLKDGALVRSPREWALAQFATLRPDTAAVLRNSLESSRVQRTFVEVGALRIRLTEGDGGAASATDGWGTLMRVTGGGARVVSAGPDRRFDTADDIVCDSTCPVERLTPGDDLGEAYTSLYLFETKYASLKSLPDAERAQIRRDALAKDVERDRTRGELLHAIQAYDALQTEDPRFSDVELLTGLLSDIRMADPSAAYLKPEHPMAPADWKSAMAIGMRLLRSTVDAHPDAWPAVEALVNADEDAGDWDGAAALLARYGAKHPADPQVPKMRMALYSKKGEFARAIEEADAMTRANPTDPEAFYTAGVLAYESVAKKPQTPAADRALIQRGMRWLDRAVQLKPEYFEAMVYQNLLYRQLAQLEADPAKKAAMVKKADELRERAREIITKKKRAERP